MDNNQLIKVYVTPCQREYLEFLVNRRIRDIEAQQAKAKRPSAGEPAELVELRVIKQELFQARS